MSFIEIKRQAVADTQSMGILYEHQATGSRVLFLENEDTNKAFTISFATPPYNDNGITHILEHSVLNGSKKFPSKEPFVELIKGSLNTFINAMTYGDKTVYPVASTNEKDFHNLVEVYLDAVFDPKLYTDPQILQQEGWHYHLEEASDDLTYRGVVYNEMKGALASGESQLYQAIKGSLYPGSVYSHLSGGDPQAIPTLTQEAFTNYHSTYYHPSNATTIVYGDGDQAAMLDLLAEYFDRYDERKDPVDLTFDIQAPSQTVERRTYSVSGGEDPANKDFIALAWHATTADQLVDKVGLEILAHVLLANTSSPLKKALLEAGVGGDVDGGCLPIGYPLGFYVSAKFTDESQLDQLEAVTYQTLKGLVAEGIDQDLIQGTINQIVFALKESMISESHPRGITYAIQSLDGSLYGVSPFEALDSSSVVEEIQAKADKGYFEGLIQQYLLDNDHKTKVILAAEAGKNAKEEAEVHQALQTYKASLSEAEVQDLVDTTQALILRQNTPDTQEDLEKIPSLERQDLETHEEAIELNPSSFFGEQSFYQSPQFTAGIDYVNLYFNIEDFSWETYPVLSFYSQLLGHLATENYAALDLAKEVSLHTGGIQFGLNQRRTLGGDLILSFVAQGKALEDQLDQLLDLMAEIFSRTSFEDEVMVQQLLMQLISMYDHRLASSAHQLALGRVMSHHSKGAFLAEQQGGLAYYQFLLNLRDEWEAEWPALKKELELVQSRLANALRLKAFYVGPTDRVATVKEQIQTSFAHLGQEPLAQAVDIPLADRQNEAFVVAQDVNYVAEGTNAEGILPYNGASVLLNTILRYEYLWTEIRVKGGAYGAAYSHNRSGDWGMASYRDPNLDQTLQTYQGLADFVQQIDLSDDELTKYMIGSFSGLDQPLSAYDRGVKALAMHEVGLTAKDREILKEEILQTSNANLHAIGEKIQSLSKDSSIVVIGNKEKIEASAERFDQITTLS